MVDDPLDDPAWCAHLFQTQTEEQIGRWARALSWFRFCRGRPSPFLTEPDRLLVALAWRDAADLGVLLDSLGLVAAPDGWQDLDGVRVRVEGGRGRLTLGVSGAEQRRPQIVDHDVDAAREVEVRLAALADLGDRLIDPPLDDRSCVAPGRYPRLFGEPG